MEEKEELINDSPSEISSDNNVEELESAKKESQIDLEVVFVEKQTELEENYAEKIEAERLALYDAFKKSKRLSNIMMSVVLVIAIGSIFLVTYKEIPALQVVGWVLIGLAVVGMIVFYVLTHNKFPNKTKEYIKFITYALNQRNFDDTRFQEVHYNPKEKFEIADILSDGLYKEISQMSSRNVVRGKYDGHNFICADVALYEERNKRQRSPLFVGKYITLSNDLHFEGKVVLVSKNAEKAIDLPNALEDANILEDKDNFTIYGPEGTKVNELLGRDFAHRIKQIQIKEGLLNLSVVVWAGHTAVYASYTDDVMALPFNNAFPKEANEQFRGNLQEIFINIRKLLK